MSPDELRAPSTILMTIWSGRSVLATAVGTTLYEAVLGLVCGTAIGVLSGVVFSRFRLLERMFLPYWFRLPNFVLPTPQEIVSAALENPRRLMADAVATVTEAIGGYMAGSALGLAIAIAFVMLPIAGRLLMPLYVIVNSVPMIAYGPLAIIFWAPAPRRRWC